MPLQTLGFVSADAYHGALKKLSTAVMDMILGRGDGTRKSSALASKRASLLYSERAAISWHALLAAVHCFLMRFPQQQASHLISAMNVLPQLIISNGVIK